MELRVDTLSTTVTKIISRRARLEQRELAGWAQPEAYSQVRVCLRAGVPRQSPLCHIRKVSKLLVTTALNLINTRLVAINSLSRGTAWLTCSNSRAMKTLLCCLHPSPLLPRRASRWDLWRSRLSKRLNSPVLGWLQPPKVLNSTRWWRSFQSTKSRCIKQGFISRRLSRSRGLQAPR